MALSIKTEEADRLARELSNLTGETMTEAVTIALRERLRRTRQGQERTEAQESRERYIARVNRLLDKISPHYEQRPVTAEEWADAGHDEIDDLAGDRRSR
jgi:antitoxin VapB